MSDNDNSFNHLVSKAILSCEMLIIMMRMQKRDETGLGGSVIFNY